MRNLTPQDKKTGISVGPQVRRHFVADTQLIQQATKEKACIDRLLCLGVGCCQILDFIGGTIPKNYPWFNYYISSPALGKPCSNQACQACHCKDVPIETTAKTFIKEGFPYVFPMISPWFSHDNLHFWRFFSRFSPWFPEIFAKQTSIPLRAGAGQGATGPSLGLDQRHQQRRGQPGRWVGRGTPVFNTWDFFGKNPENRL